MYLTQDEHRLRSERARRAFRRRAGRAGARYWRERDFENLRKARDAHTLKAWVRWVETLRWRLKEMGIPLTVILQSSCGQLHEVEALQELTPLAQRALRELLPLPRRWNSGWGGGKSHLAGYPPGARVGGMPRGGRI
jgi:hypothetical protein